MKPNTKQKICLTFEVIGVYVLYKREKGEYR